MLDVLAQSWRSDLAGGRAGSGDATLRFRSPDGYEHTEVSLGRGTVRGPELWPGRWTVVVDPGRDSVGSVTARLRFVTPAT